MLQHLLVFISSFCGCIFHSAHIFSASPNPFNFFFFHHFPLSFPLLVIAQFLLLFLAILSISLHRTQLQEERREVSQALLTFLSPRLSMGPEREQMFSEYLLNKFHPQPCSKKESLQNIKEYCLCSENTENIQIALKITLIFSPFNDPSFSSCQVNYHLLNMAVWEKL